MPVTSLPVTLVRGGTSRGVFLRAADVPLPAPNATGA